MLLLAVVRRSGRFQMVLSSCRHGTTEEVPRTATSFKIRTNSSDNGSDFAIPGRRSVEVDDDDVVVAVNGGGGDGWFPPSRSGGPLPVSVLT